MANGLPAMNAWLQRVLPRSFGTEEAGLAALGLFAFLAPQGHAGAKWGLLFLTVAAIPCWRELIRNLVRDPLFHVVWVLGLYIFVRAALAARALPETAADQWGAALGLGLSGFFVLLVAWWLRGDSRRIALLGGMAVAGLCMEVLADGRLVELEWVVRGAERHLIGSALPMAALGGLALLALIAGLPTALEQAFRRSRRAGVSVGLCALLVTILLASLQVITQSRIVVGMLVLLVPAILLVQLLKSTGNPRWRRITGVVALVLMIVLSGVVALIGPQLVQKMDHELDQVVPYLDAGDFREMPPSSLGWRVQLVDAGLEVGAERPWFGWGPGTSTTKHLLERFDREHLAHLHHLHNVPLEIWVRLGIVGLVLYAAALLCLVRSALQAASAHRIPAQIGAFLLAGGILVAGYSLVEFRLLSWDLGVGLIMVAATAHSFGNWRMRDATGGKSARGDAGT